MNVAVEPMHYEDIPWFRRNWFALVCGLLFAPALIPILLTGNIYYTRHGVIKKYAVAARIILLMWSAAITVGLARDIYAVTASETPRRVATVGGDRVPRQSSIQTKTSQEEAATESPDLLVGDVFKTGKFEISVSSEAAMESVGSDGMGSHADPGGIYIAVNWWYENVSPSPADGPLIELMSPDGTMYEPDGGASGIYSNDSSDGNFGTNSGEAVNPGIRYRVSDVFEVSKKMFDQNSWRVAIGVAGQVVPVSLNVSHARVAKQDIVGAPASAATHQPASPASNQLTQESISTGQPPVAQTGSTMGAIQPTASSAASPATISRADPASAKSSQPANAQPPTGALNGTASAAEITPVRPSFNCALARSAVEGTICGSAELSALDTKLSALYLVTLRSSLDPKAIRDQQRAWMHQRNACGASVPCLEQRYQERIAQLQ